MKLERGDFKYSKASFPTSVETCVLSAFKILVGGAIFSSLLACSSPTTRLGSEDPIGDYKNSRADGAAWAAEGFTFRKQMPIRPANDFEFYYKHCDLTGDSTFTSKTSYWCTNP